LIHRPADASPNDLPTAAVVSDNAKRVGGWLVDERDRSVIGDDMAAVAVPGECLAPTFGLANGDERYPSWWRTVGERRAGVLAFPQEVCERLRLDLGDQQASVVDGLSWERHPRASACSASSARETGPPYSEQRVSQAIQPTQSPSASARRVKHRGQRMPADEGITLFHSAFGANQ
jgi:hypothetical protein